MAAGLRFDGGSFATGPPVPPTLPGLGKDGWSHYWHADSITASGPAATWPDAMVGVGKDDMTRVVVDPGAGTPEPQLMVESGVRFVRFAGIDLQSSQATPMPRSFVIVLRSLVQQGMLEARLAGGGISRLQTVSPYIYRVNPGGFSILGPNSSGTDLWMCLIGTMDATGPIIRFNAAEVASGTAYTPPTTVALTNAQHPVVSTVAPAAPTQPAGTFYVDVHLEAVFPFALAAEDRASIYAAIKAGNPSLGLP